MSLIPNGQANLLNGIVTLKGEALARDHRRWDEDLYAAYHPADRADFQSVKITAIPYYAWANREPGPMQVWIPVCDA